MQKKFVPVMITPFNLKAQIDMGMVEYLVDFYLEAGVKGFFANCLSSEMYSISEDERLDLTRHVVRYVNGRVPVVATGSFGLTIPDKALFTEKLYDTGVDSVIMITGHFANVDEPDEVLLQRFEQMFSLTGNIPLGLYECPAPYKRVITPEILRTLLATNRLIYHKDTSCNADQVKAKLAVVEGSRLEFYDAHTPNGVSSMQMGAAGMSSISGNFYPEILVWLCNHVNDESCQEDVKWIQEELRRVDPLIHVAYPLSAKYFMQLRGMPVRTISRAHALELTPDQKLVLQQIYRDFKGWCERLQIREVVSARLTSH
ncbi:dihydrodipicolinate synthase family protein [Chitinophaga polysaccharea]|uniref:dihydrodipicolinate synthase family protein n=1 Tax=Chitinophaga TaxID=79328 RepID=UPI001455214B|nr:MULTISPECIES: dihydrodipicolinate synthase family protein [Chitinophaga]NLR57811.1 dihydrodipicolinate synthase family protein [Chitinophaga polysaccharea]NLU93404.1 dihydrodipicolinate synthase family protein [Chitinophaga sp. Ak27]